MINISLRAYNREIESLIDQGHTEEAVAHCMHILKVFPKHLETYRLMGKAYLEAHRYSEAADIFLRVLLAVPDDFVSHLGMSIVRDEKHDLPGAIWHMERAFEINSTNAGIQNELRRLYGRRDGAEPGRIHLTRGALAQIYLKAGEYQQAIAEVKSVLAEDNTRNDMKTLLARAYFRAGMKNEAVEACNELIKLYPFNLDANRILVEILASANISQGIEQYRRRIHSLDPYASHVSGTVFDTTTVSEDLVMIEQLDWDPGQTGSRVVPVASIHPGSELPDWMQQSGWEASNGGPELETNLFEEVSTSDQVVSGLAEAEIPEWLQAMAPAPAMLDATPANVQPGVPQANVPEEEADFAWLDSLGTPPVVQSSEQAAPTQEGLHALPPSAIEDGGMLHEGLHAQVETTQENTDWLNELHAVQPETTPAQPSAPELPGWLGDLESPAPEQAVFNQDVPDWLSDLTSDSSTSQSTDESIPDWMKSLSFDSQEAAVGGDVPQVTPAVPQPQEMAIQPDDQPDEDGGEFANPLDWMKDLVIEPPDVPTTELGTSQTTPENIEDVPGWMQTAATITPAVTPDPEDLPAWMKDIFGEAPTAESAQVQLPEAAIKENDTAWTGEFLSSPETPGAATEPVDEWRGSLEETSYNLETEPAEDADHEVENAVNELDRLDAQVTPETSGKLLEDMPTDQAEAFKWLENLMVGQGVSLNKPAETAPESTAPVDDMVSVQDESQQWLGSLVQAPDALVETPQPVDNQQNPTANTALAAEPAADVPEEPVLSALVTGPGTSVPEQDDALAWLESLAQKQGANPEELITAADARSDTAPSWVTADEPQVEPAATATEEPVLSALVTGPGTSVPEQDDALAWLESLAQKQGANPEELITAADARSDTAPSWVTAVEPQAEPAATAPEEPVLSALVTGPGTSASEQDDALAWLESLAQKQGANPEELITAADARSDIAPNWVTGTESVSQPEDWSWLETAPQTETETPAEVPLQTPEFNAQEEDLSWLSSLPAIGSDSTLSTIPGTEESAPAPVDTQPAMQDSSNMDETRPMRRVTFAQKQAAARMQTEMGDDSETDAITPQPDLTELGTAAAGFADANAEDQDIDWLGDLSKPLEVSGLASTEPEAAARPFPIPAEAELPDTPDVELGWLATPNRVDPSSEQTIESAVPLQQEDVVEESDWFTSLNQPGNTQQAEPMPWEQEAQPTQVAPDLSPIFVGPDEDGETGELNLPSLPSFLTGESPAGENSDWSVGLDASETGQDDGLVLPTTIEVPDQVTPMVVASTDFDDTADWLASLEEGAPPHIASLPWKPASETPEPASRIESSIGENPLINGVDDDDAWLNSLDQDVTPQAVDHLTWEPASINIEPVSQPVAAAQPISQPEDTLDWLESLGDQTSPVQLDTTPIENQSTQGSMPWDGEDLPGLQPAVSQSNAPEGDIAEWLQHLDKEEDEHFPDTLDKTVTWLSPVSIPVPAEDSEIEELPDWLRDPAVDELPVTVVSQQPPVQPAKIVPPEPVIVPPVKQAEPVAASEPVVDSQPVERMSSLPSRAAALGNDKDSQALQKARELLSRGGLSDAMLEYTRLIKKGKLLEEVIYDLQEAVYQYPVDVILWQTLGDAYFRSNRIQEALDAYGKAEGLLR